VHQPCFGVEADLQIVDFQQWQFSPFKSREQDFCGTDYWNLLRMP
jgi:hypothetical protein